VRRGDTVITGGGIIGKITKVYDGIGELEVEICDGMRIRVIRSTLSDVRVKGEPVSEEKSKLNAKTKTPQKSKAVTKKNVDKEKKAVSKESR
ncbi:MAG: preprotein translocase subunit YajC, partial [Bartonella sp.]|nr:preprotein translocase subunit YajC [Bartonella sp.]